MFFDIRQSDPTVDHFVCESLLRDMFRVFVVAAVDPNKMRRERDTSLVLSIFKVFVMMQASWNSLSHPKFAFSRDTIRTG